MRPLDPLFPSSKDGPKFSPRQRLDIGLASHYAEENADAIAVRFNCSRSYVYECAVHTRSFLDQLDDEILTSSMFILDRKMISAMVISLSCACKSSLEGIQSFFGMMFNYHISIGKISQILNDAGEKAAKVNSRFMYDNVKQIGSDEIYMGQDMPIMTIVDLDTTFLCTMTPTDVLSADKWESLTGELQESQHLDPDICVMDGGSALNKGVPAGLKNTSIQPDIFHMFKDVGYEISKFGRYVESLINDENQLIISANGKKIHKKSVLKLKEVQEELSEVLPIYDNIESYYQLIRSYFGFCGYTHDLIYRDVCDLINDMLSYLPSLNDIVKEECRNTLKDPAAVKRSYMTRKWKRLNSLRKALHKLLDRIEKDGALGFIKRLEVSFTKLAEEYDVPLQSVHDVYRLSGYRYRSDEYRNLEDRIISDLYILNRLETYEMIWFEITEGSFT